MCGMEVSEHPDWIGALELPDGSVRFGCSVRCTLAMALHAPKFLGVPADQLKHVRVPDYLHPGTLLEAQAAFYVVDSDVKGPMGVELVPAATPAEARALFEKSGFVTLTPSRRDEPEAGSRKPEAGQGFE